MMVCTVLLSSTISPSLRSASVFTHSSKALSSLRASPPEMWNSAPDSSTRMVRPVRCRIVSTARSSMPCRSSSSSGFRIYTWQRESSGEITSNDGFSVVAPISVTMPASTAPSNESCWFLLNRWISSMKRMHEVGTCRAFSMTSRTSLTPELMALSLKKGHCSLLLISSASVVLPTPGGPQNIMEGILPFWMA